MKKILIALLLAFWSAALFCEQGVRNTEQNGFDEIRKIRSAVYQTGEGYRYITLPYDMAETSGTFYFNMDVNAGDALYFPRVCSSYELYGNGKLLVSVKDGDPRIFQLTQIQGKIHFTLKVSDPYTTTPGIQGPILLGPTTQIMRIRLKKVTVDIIFASIMGALAFFSLVGTIGKQNPKKLYFLALFSASWCIRFLFRYEAIGVYLLKLPAGISHGLTSLTIPLYILAIKEILTSASAKERMRVYYVISDTLFYLTCVVQTVGALVLPSIFAYQSAPVIHSIQLVLGILITGPSIYRGFKQQNLRVIVISVWGIFIVSALFSMLIIPLPIFHQYHIYNALLILFTVIVYIFEQTKELSVKGLSSKMLKPKAAFDKLILTARKIPPGIAKISELFKLGGSSEKNNSESATRKN